MDRNNSQPPGLLVQVLRSCGPGRPERRGTPKPLGGGSDQPSDTSRAGDLKPGLTNQFRFLAPSLDLPPEAQYFLGCSSSSPAACKSIFDDVSRYWHHVASLKANNGRPVRSSAHFGRLLKSWRHATTPRPPIPAKQLKPEMPSKVSAVDLREMPNKWRR
ncbi:uncharacterized protein EI97DRAFT_27820 [Westerdykella ornata]|uniref:Uncharacterized protein n=1 Tax=Westerdykella ornata TaxID=318751 RepID=A0A6A6JXN4_WESOR|nr:uncharacterized protein EI97DRAFT_27820 [Westerdykella ornata]KAF2281381.1 hypothetical protein EI97DRAFT_27820 [Westerdykella ornata]